MTRVSIFGLGYVGAVTAACLAGEGHTVIGVDVAEPKVDRINAGLSPLVEPGLDELIAEGVAGGRLRATTDSIDGIRSSDVSLICVGTPSAANGGLDLEYVRRVCESIGHALRTKDGHHVVVARSTMLPGSTEEVIIPALELASGRRVGEELGVAYNPEFLREGSSLRDFRHPPFTVIGAHDPRAVAAVEALYATVSGDRFTVPYRVAEMVKYASNAYHALKIAFANEIGVLCKAHGIDSHELMELFARDQKLNISAAYLRPGFAFGGSCLPKDLRALLHQAHRLDIEAPVLEAILPSNRDHVERAYTMVRATGARRIAVLGFSFKAGTDDLRESPVVELIERLIGKGLEVVVYDRSVSLAALSGSNRAFIEREIPHIASIMVESIEEAVAHAEVVVVGNPDAEFQGIAERIRSDQRLIDLVKVASTGTLGDRYAGVAW